MATQKRTHRTWIVTASVTGGRMILSGIPTDHFNDNGEMKRTLRSPIKGPRIFLDKEGKAHTPKRSIGKIQRFFASHDMTGKLVMDRDELRALFDIFSEDDRIAMILVFTNHCETVEPEMPSEALLRQSSVA